MLKVQQLWSKLTQKAESLSKSRISFRTTVAQLMLLVMIWQALVQPTLALTSRNGDEAKKSDKDVTANVPATTVQSPGDLVIVRHAPSINGSRIEGNVRVLLGESININSGSAITGDLLVPGSPNITLNGNNNYNGTIVGTGNPQPTGYSINLNSNISLHHIISRTDAVTISPVPSPPLPTGTRDISLNKNDQPGDFSTIRNLTINSNYGDLTVPQGTYGNLIANSNSGLTFGVVGQSTTYNIQSLTLNSNSLLNTLGNVTINVQSNVNLNSQVTMGDVNSPISLALNMANGSLSLNSNSTFYGVVKTPNGQVSLNANSLLKGLITCDRLTANSNTKIQNLVSDITNPTITITSPLDGAVINQAQVAVTGTVDDESFVTVKVNGVNAAFNGTTFSATVPLNLGSNTVTAVATDAFGHIGQAQVTVSRGDGTNQPPVVNAGQDLAVNLPNPATLNGTVTDDGKPNPPGALTITWSKNSGPGTVTFSSPNTAVTNVTFSSAGTYILQLTASDSQLSSSDTVTVTVSNNTANQAPVVSAGPDLNVTLPAAATLNGTVTDDGLPSNQLTVSWTKISGPGTVSFANSQAAQTTATFSSAGIYTLRLSASDGALTSSDDVIVTVQMPAANFSIMAAPTSVTTVQNSTATYMVTVIANDPNFRNLIGLQVSGLPGTSRAIFNPQQVVSGASSTLTVDLSNSGVGVGTYTLTITGSTPIGGITENHSITVSLVVQAATQTSLSGRVLSSLDEPLSGVTVSLDGQSATTDAAGAFLLTGVLAGNQRAVLVDGRTSSSVGITYPVIAEPVNIVANQSNQMPYTFYLPRIDTQYEVTVIPNQNTIVTTPRVNNLQTTIPAGANLRNRDGSVVTRVSMTPVPIDRTPAPLPADISTMMVYTNQPGGAISDIAMPVTYPNLSGVSPGILLDLYTFNHDTVQWQKYGVGKVSADGKTIVPEIDPSTNKPYGLKDFSWHFVRASKDGNVCPRQCTSCQGKNPVDLFNGIKIEREVDIAFGGVRGGLMLGRTYTSDRATITKGQFGLGTRSNYEMKLAGSFTQGGSGKLILPEDVFIDPTQPGGYLFSYSSTDANGSLVFTSTAMSGLLGDELRKLTNGSFEYRYKNGDIVRFDATGRMAAMVDRNGNTTTLTYTGANLTQITDPVGRSINLTYDGNGNIITATDPIGRTWNYTYDANGFLSKATDPLNNSMQYAYYGITGLLSTVTDKRGNVIKQVTYDSNGRVISQKFADGGIESYEYSFSGSVNTKTKITDPEGRVTLKRFNALGYVIAEVDGLGQPSVINIDINTNLPVQTIGPCGCQEDARSYDSKGNIITVIDRSGQITKYEYDSIFSFVTKITDRNQHITLFGYDSHGNRTSMTNAKSQVTQWIYDQFGEQTSRIDALSHTWSMSYDIQGNIISKSDPLTNTSTFTYDGIGRMLSTSDPLGRTSAMTYDAIDRIISETDPANATTTFTYDQNDNQIAITNALNNTWTMVYDSKNRMISQRFPLTLSDNGIQREIKMEYNKNDELIAKVSPLGRTIRYTYDARGQRKTVTDALGASVTYNYDINQNLIALSDYRNNVTAFEYDELYRITKVTDPSNKSSRYTYDSEGNMLSMVDRLNRTTSFSYDELNRLLITTYVDAIVTNRYDAAGRKIRVDDTEFGGTFIAWDYDNANRLLSETTHQGIVSYTYNEASQRRSLVVADRPAVNYLYDNTGRLSTINQNLGQGLEEFTYSYDILSRRTSLQRPNGVITTWGYDQNNRLTQIKHQKGNSIIENFQYSYDADDEVVSIATQNAQALLSADKIASAADVNNRINQFGNTNISFDDLGQTLSKTVIGTGTSFFQWDHRGRLIKVTLPNNQEINYSYDPVGRRITSGNSTNITAFLYDGREIVQDINSNNKVDYLNSYVIDEKLRQSSNAGVFYFTQDQLNSINTLTNNNGDVVERINYDIYGNTTASTLTRYGYTGRELDSSTGLYYYRFRWFDSQQSRFLSEDPIGFRGGLNFYSYVRNNPLRFIDPLGLQANALTPNVDLSDPAICATYLASLGATAGLVVGGIGGLAGVIGGPVVIVTTSGGAELGGAAGFFIGSVAAYIFCKKSKSKCDTVPKVVPKKADPDKPDPDNCDTAIKILEQFERLAAKYGIDLPIKRLTKLNELREAGSIKVTDLPAGLRTKFPGEFANDSLQDIKDKCGKK